MNSSQITNKVMMKFPYINEAFIVRVRTGQGWGVFVPSSDEEEQEEILRVFGRPPQEHPLAGIVIPLGEEESASLDAAQSAFNAAGGLGQIA